VHSVPANTVTVPSENILVFSRNVVLKYVVLPPMATFLDKLLVVQVHKTEDSSPCSQNHALVYKLHMLTTGMACILPTQCINVLRTILAQRATTALNVVNQFVFTSKMEMGRFLYKKKTECLYIIWMNKRLVASLSPRWPRFDPSQPNCNWTQWHRDTLFSQYFGFPLSVSFHHCSIIIVIFNHSYQNDKRAKTGNF
jgi:hypothetical protein